MTTTATTTAPATRTTSTPSRPAARRSGRTGLAFGLFFVISFVAGLAAVAYGHAVNAYTGAFDASKLVDSVSFLWTGLWALRGVVLILTVVALLAVPLVKAVKAPEGKGAFWIVLLAIAFAAIVATFAVFGFTTILGWLAWPDTSTLGLVVFAAAVAGIAALLTFVSKLVHK